MAQTYEIDIKRFNGQDYDTLLPTPAAHAATHQANGSDPLTLQAGNYGASSIPTAAYQNSSVTRAKLAQDALYSPVKLITDGYSIQPEDVGVFLYNAYSSDVGITLTKAASAQLVSHGPEFPIVNWGGGSVTITGSGGIVFCVNGETSTFLNKAIKITEPNTTIALKKMGVNSSGEVWFVIGNVEVVA